MLAKKRSFWEINPLYGKKTPSVSSPIKETLVAQAESPQNQNIKPDPFWTKIPKAFTSATVFLLLFGPTILYQFSDKMIVADYFDLTRTELNYFLLSCTFYTFLAALGIIALGVIGVFSPLQQRMDALFSKIGSFLHAKNIIGMSLFGVMAFYMIAMFPMFVWSLNAGSKIELAGEVGGKRTELIAYSKANISSFECKPAQKALAVLDAKSLKDFAPSTGIGSSTEDISNQFNAAKNQLQQNNKDLAGTC